MIWAARLLRRDRGDRFALRWRRKAVVADVDEGGKRRGEHGFGTVEPDIGFLTLGDCLWLVPDILTRYGPR